MQLEHNDISSLEIDSSQDKSNGGSSQEEFIFDVEHIDVSSFEHTEVRSLELSSTPNDAIIYQSCIIQ